MPLAATRSDRHSFAGGGGAPHSHLTSNAAGIDKRQAAGMQAWAWHSKLKADLTRGFYL